MTGRLSTAYSMFVIPDAFGMLCLNVAVHTKPLGENFYNMVAILILRAPSPQLKEDYMDDTVKT